LKIVVPSDSGPDLRIAPLCRSTLPRFFDGDVIAQSDKGRIVLKGLNSEFTQPYRPVRLVLLSMNRRGTGERKTYREREQLG
jgi:hypothetical protein